MCTHIPPVGVSPNPAWTEAMLPCFSKDLYMSFFRKKNTVQEVNTAKPKKVNRNRTERLCLGLTQDEKQLITDGARNAGMSRTDFILNAVEGNRVVVITDLSLALQELSRQGNNLNQIARCLNQRGSVSKETIEKTSKSCLRAYEQLALFADNWNVKLKRLEEK